ncbi:MAG: SpoIIE family protein phosphatase [Phycisphaeraceae bacterium]|nr:SpoIIE family protein phosphatase [Phycisphaeraceae bacterium]
MTTRSAHAVEVAPPMAALNVDPAQLARLLSVGERLAASNDLDEVLALVIDAMRDVLRADRASVFQFDPQAQELFISQAHGVGAIRFPITKGIAGESARLGRILNIPDCYADSRFNPEIDRKTGYKTRNMLTIPLLSPEAGAGGAGASLEGVAQVLNKDPARGSAFDATDEALARYLASQAAIALRRAKFIVGEVRKKKIEADLAVARTIQQNSWPKCVPQMDGFDIAASALPADETGGDAYDLIDLRSLPPAAPDAAPSGSGMLFALGDATGHGIGPALSVAQFRAMLRMGARLHASVSQIARHINIQLCDDLPAGRFITNMIALLDPRASRIRYVSAGQAPLILVRADGTSEVRGATTLPMGIDPDCDFSEVETFDLAPGDVFVLLSDGFYEAMNHENEHYGEQRIVETVLANIALPAQGILETLAKGTLDFAQGRPFDDDQTAIIIKRLPENA